MNEARKLLILKFDENPKTCRSNFKQKSLEAGIEIQNWSNFDFLTAEIKKSIYDESLIWRNVSLSLLSTDREDLSHTDFCHRPLHLRLRPVRVKVKNCDDNFSKQRYRMRRKLLSHENLCPVTYCDIFVP